MATNTDRNGRARVRPTRKLERGQHPEQDRPPRRTERLILDQAIAINGELRVKLLGLNLLPIQVRLLISSKEVAAELGLDWWQRNRDATARRNAAKRRST